MNTNVKVFVFIIILLILGTMATAFLRTSGTINPTPSASGKYDAFAQCLKDKKAVFYGAFWCPHCQNTKKMFGSSAKLLPYVECSTLDGTGQVKECADQNITGYPTWVFADGSRLTGEVTFEQLSEKSGCALPSDAKPASTGQ